MFLTVLSLCSLFRSLAPPSFYLVFYYIIIIIIIIYIRIITVFIRFMRSYPAEGQAELIFDAIVKAIGKGLDPDQMRKDADELKAWAEGKTEADVIEAMKGEDRRCEGGVSWRRKPVLGSR